MKKWIIKNIYKNEGLSKQLIYLLSCQNKVNYEVINILQNLSLGKFEVMQGEGRENRWADSAQIHTLCWLTQPVHLCR